MSKSQIALFGAGTIGRTHIDRIARSENLHLAGIADPTDAGQVLAQRLGVPWFADHISLLDATKPHGAVVSTPNSLHIAQALDCLERGVPALVEKPVADTVAEAQVLVDAQVRTGVPILVGHHRRYNPIIRRAREMVQAGALGQLVAAHVMALFLKPAPYFDANWRRHKGGGPILINLIHEIDMLRFLCGEIVSVQAIGSNAVRGFEVEDTAAAVLRFDNGAVGTVLLSDTATSAWHWDLSAGEQDQYPQQATQSHYLSGTHGSLSLPDLAYWSYKGARSWHAEISKEQTPVHKVDPYAAQLQHFAAVIAGTETPLCSALDGLLTLQATLAVSVAADTGRSVKLDPTRRSI